MSATQDSTVQQPIVPAAAVRPRLVVYDTPSLPELLEMLGALYPEHRVEAASTWPTAVAASDSAIPVWHVTETGAELEAASGMLVRDLAHPLAASSRWYVVAFAASRWALSPGEIGLRSLPLLDAEDLRCLLAHDAAAELAFSELRNLATRTPLTPIEQQLAEAFARAGIAAQPQARFGRYIVDFFVEHDNVRLAVEADGAAFHDPARDAVRDSELREMGLADVVRFTGREIYRDADACAHSVKALLNGTRPTMMWTVNESKRMLLDASQRAAVRHGDGPARVLAPAGAGKTQVLVERIAELVERGVDPSSILALAFNKKANDQLVKKLEGLGIPVSRKLLFDPNVTGVRCATFNAFGYRFQRERLGLAFETDASGARIRKLMEQAAASHLRGAKRGSDPLREFLRARERACADLTPAEEIEIEFDYIDDPQPRVIEYGPVDAEYEQLRIDARLQSFDDQLTTTVNELLRSPAERAFAQSYFSHVLVDEFQDLNAAQLTLVDILSRPWRSLFVVGDDDQLIYGWRYAKLTNILDFEQRLAGASTYVLSTNYRCSVAVVESSRRVIDLNRRRVAKDIRAKTDAPAGLVAYVRVGSWQARGRAIVEFVESAKKQTGKYEKIAVLCRFKAQQPFVAMVLDRARIPRTPLLRYRLFSDHQMKLLYAYLKLIRQPEALTNGPLLAHLLNRPNRYAPNRLVDDLKVSERPWATFAETLDGAPADYPWKGLRGFKERVEQLGSRLLAPREAIDEVVAQFGLESYWHDQKKPLNQSQDDANPLELLELIRLHADESGTLDGFLATWERKFKEEDEQAGMEDDNLGREQHDKVDRVVIGTLHASKGREYHAVALFDYHPDLAKLNDEQLEEERRVFYVGMTRACNELLITIDANKAVHSFVRASIAPPKAGEQQTLRLRETEIVRELRSATADVAQARAQLEKISNGSERSRLEAEVTAINRTLAKLDKEIESVEQEFSACGFWQRLIGRQSEIEGLLDELRSRRAAPTTLPDLDRELSLLEHDPDQYGSGFTQALCAAERRVELLKLERNSIATRFEQLELLTTDAA